MSLIVGCKVLAYSMNASSDALVPLQRKKISSINRFQRRMCCKKLFVSFCSKSAMKMFA